MTSTTSFSCPECDDTRVLWLWQQIEFLISEVLPRIAQPLPGGLGYFGGFQTPCPYCAYDDYYRPYPGSTP